VGSQHGQGYRSEARRKMSGATEAGAGAADTHDKEIERAVKIIAKAAHDEVNRLIEEELRKQGKQQQDPRDLQPGRKDKSG
jgi:hypothetical protein